jgi:hypothetical protein
MCASGIRPKLGHRPQSGQFPDSSTARMKPYLFHRILAATDGADRTIAARTTKA